MGNAGKVIQGQIIKDHKELTEQFPLVLEFSIVVLM